MERIQTSVGGGGLVSCSFIPPKSDKKSYESYEYPLVKMRAPLFSDCVKEVSSICYGLSGKYLPGPVYGSDGK